MEEKLDLIIRKLESIEKSQAEDRAYNQKTSNLIIEEIGNVQEKLQKKIKTVEKNLEELNQYYRITKLENDNTALLLRMINDLSQRIEKLENKN